MSLEDILHEIAQLNAEERQELRQYLNHVPEKTSRLTPVERTQRLNAALDAMGDDLSQAELDNMTAAMTEEYIEPWDESDFAALCARSSPPISVIGKEREQMHGFSGASSVEPV